MAKRNNMGLTIWFSKHGTRFLVPGVLGMCFVYFLYHAFQGDRGIFGLVELSQACELQTLHLKALMQKKEDLENKVCLMSDKIDLDLLEYQVRLLLGYRGENELIMLTSAEIQGPF